MPKRSPLNRRSPWRRAAFTLLEVLVAMAVMSIMLLAIYQAYSSTILINATTNDLWRVITFVNNDLAAWERKDNLSVSVDQGTYPPDHPLAGYNWTRRITDEEPLPTVKVRKVMLEITWGPEGQQHSFRSEIYVAPR